MWIVRVALNRPYTFIVLALLILILSPIVIQRTPTDIFPEIDIPVIAVVWNFTGMSAEEMEGRMTSVYERVLTTLVNNIEHIESTTVNGVGGGQDFLTAACQRRRGPSAGDGGIADHFAADAARRGSSAGNEL
ncbi:MAG: efflux RND transporter permease subunit [Ignavibacteriota bacterium]